MKFYLYIQSGEVRLIPGEKMPVKPDFKGDYFLHYGPQKQYEESLEIAKRDSILCADQDRAKMMCFEFKQSSIITEGEIYGPFEGEYKFKIECLNLNCSGQCGECNAMKKVAILSDPSPKLNCEKCFDWKECAKFGCQKPEPVNKENEQDEKLLFDVWHAAACMSFEDFKKEAVKYSITRKQ
jgi:hypothetical protein